MNVRNGTRPVHPDEILREELDTLDLSASALSKALGVPVKVNRITLILRGQRSMTADTALRLARYFGTTPELLMVEHDIGVRTRIRRAIKRIDEDYFKQEAL